MANTKSAAKRARQTTKRTSQNRRTLTSVKSNLKKVRGEIAAGKKESVQADYRQLASSLDKAVKSGRIHWNAANRHKSRLNKALAALT